MEWTHTIKPVHMLYTFLCNRDFQTNKGKFYLDFDIAEAAGGVVFNVLCVQRDLYLWRIYNESTESRDTLVSLKDSNSDKSLLRENRFSG